MSGFNTTKFKTEGKKALELATNSVYDNAKVFINVMSPPAPLAKAKGDFSVDDYQAIQACLDYAYANGGGTVFIPEGHYKCTRALYVKDYVKLEGAGYSSWIENTSVGGFTKNVVATGNIGDTSAGTSMFNETSYALNNITAGAASITFTTASNANSFSVGDIVFIQSGDKWGMSGADSIISKYMNVNIVQSISGGTLTLKYHIPDNYNSPIVAKNTKILNGYDGLPTWFSRNVEITNIRLTHQIGLASGWYGIMLDGIDCKVEKVWMDSVSCPIGSNMLAYSTVKDITSTYDLRAMDMCDFQVHVSYDNITLTRTGVNSNLPGALMGFAIHDGVDNTIKNSKMNFGNYGILAGTYTHRFICENVQVYGANSDTNTAAIYGCLGEGFKAIKNIVSGGKYHGIYACGNKAHVDANIVKNMAYNSGYYGVYLTANATDSLVENNILGDNGSRTINDSVYQQGGSFTASNTIRNNVEYTTLKPYINKAYVATSSLTDYVLNTYSLPIPKKKFALKITASGYRSGVANTKSVKLKLNGTVIAQVDYIATDTNRWYITAIVSANDYDVNPRCFGEGWKDATSAYKQVQQVTNGLATATTLDLTGVVANAADSVACDMFVVEVIEA